MAGGKVLAWIHEWLSGRKQQVCNGCKSAWRPVISGVPQGSVLRSVLFLIFINYLDSALTSSVLKFVDDTKLFAKVNNKTDKEIIQKDLHQLKEWSNTWQMPFNSSKCKVLHFGASNKEFSYFKGNHMLEPGRRDGHET